MTQRRDKSSSIGLLDSPEALSRWNYTPIESNQDRESLIFAGTAHVVQRAVLNLSDENLLSLARDRAQDPSVFEEENSRPYFWGAEISNNKLDTYFSRMMPSTLKNYAEDSDSGVAFLTSHNWRDLPIGGSLKGKYIGPSGNGIARCLSAFYTIPGSNIASVPTDELIRNMRAGIVRDVSVGFYGGTSICSICGNDMWDYRQCTHWPGDWYPTFDDGKPTGQSEMAIEQIEDARLAEVSAVYDGACPGAGIMKALMSMEAGTLEPAMARKLEARYRIKLPGSRHVVPGIGEGEMANRNNNTDPNANGRTGAETGTEETDETRAAAEARIEEERQQAAERERQERERTNPPPAPVATFDRSVLTAGTMSAETVQAVNDELSRLSAEVTRLTPLADDGNAYRTDLINDAIAEGIRASSDPAKFPAEHYRLMMKGQSLESIKATRDFFKSQAAERIQGGRQSAELETGPDGQPLAPAGTQGRELPQRTDAPTEVEIKPPASVFRTGY